MNGIAGLGKKSQLFTSLFYFCTIKTALIKHLTHTEIDKTKWDLCIEKASNSFIYAYSWFLDVVSPNWEALVYGDYEAVMPLTCKKKFYFNYLHQPFFTQQLGVFSRFENQSELTRTFLMVLPAKFKYIDINLNEENDNTAFPLVARKNYILPIDNDYKEIYSAYKDQAKRNIKKAKQAGLYIQVIPHKQVVDFYAKHKGKDTKGVKTKDYKTLKRVYKICKKQNYLLSFGVFSKQKGLLASAVFLVKADRIIYHLGTANEEGKQNGAMHFLMDSVISQLIGTNRLLDFEGSEKEGIERFYKSFGAFNKPYFKLKINRLPFFIAWLK